MKKRTMFIVQTAMIAALYAVLTVGQNFLLPGSASMAIQFRISEALCVLAFFTPTAIPGLTLGCIISNIFTIGVLPVDFIFGSLASLLAASLMYALRNLKLKDIPFLGLLMPALCNGIIIGLEIEIFFIEGNFNFLSFLTSCGTVALGELGVLIILGIPLYILLCKKWKFLKKYDI